MTSALALPDAGLMTTRPPTIETDWATRMELALVDCVVPLNEPLTDTLPLLLTLPVPVIPPVSVPATLMSDPDIVTSLFCMEAYENAVMLLPGQVGGVTTAPFANVWTADSL